MPAAPQNANAPAQLAFLQSAITTSKADYTVIVQHQPIFGTTSGYGFSDALTNSSSPFAAEIALLTKYNVSAVFTGDDYVVHYGRPANITLTHQFNVGSVAEANCGESPLAPG